jgi:hypothetical protein
MKIFLKFILSGLTFILAIVFSVLFLKYVILSVSGNFNLYGILGSAFFAYIFVKITEFFLK